MNLRTVFGVCCLLFLLMTAVTGSVLSGIGLGVGFALYDYALSRDADA